MCFFFSRYFSSSATTNSVPVKSKSTPNTRVPSPEKVEHEENVLSTSCNEKTNKESDQISCPESEESPLSPVNDNFQSKTCSTFKWNKLSEVYSHSNHITVETSKATGYKFKRVNPQNMSQEHKENCDTSVLEAGEESPSSSQCPSSQTSSTSDVCSVDNDSFRLTPTSLPLTPDDSPKVSIDASDPSIPTTVRYMHLVYLYL